MIQRPPQRFVDKPTRRQPTCISARLRAEDVRALDSLQASRGIVKKGRRGRRGALLAEVVEDALSSILPGGAFHEEAAAVLAAYHHVRRPLPNPVTIYRPTPALVAAIDAMAATLGTDRSGALRVLAARGLPSIGAQIPPVSTELSLAARPVPSPPAATVGGGATLRAAQQTPGDEVKPWQSKRPTGTPAKR